MSNALVAGAVDTTSPFSGLWLIEDGQGLAAGIQNGDWIQGGLSAFGTIMDTAAAVLDPLGQLLGMGFAWVIDHLYPLNEWFNNLTGHAGEVAGFAETWQNIANRMHESGDLMKSRLSALDDMSGETIDAYLAYANGFSRHLHAVGDWSSAIGTGMQIASTIVQIVHDLVRDAISQVMGTAVSAMAMSAVTLGLGTPVAVAQVVTRVSSLATKVGRAVDKLKVAINALVDLVSKLQNLMRKAGNVFDGVGHGGRSGGPKATVETPPPLPPRPGSVPRTGGASSPPARLPEVEVRFDVKHHDPIEFGRQTKLQEEGLNSLTLDEFLNNRDHYLQYGRNNQLGKPAQKLAREEAELDKISALREQGVGKLEAENLAAEWMKSQAALHSPDQVAGGFADRVTGLGDSSINSSLGSQWKNRIDDLDRNLRKVADELTPEDRQRTLLNVKLSF